METDNIKVSVLITVKNAKETIKECILSLEDQDFNDKYEIVVIDSFSTDGTREILKEFSKKYKNIRVFEYESTQPEAYNYAIRNNLVRGKIVSLIDGDCIADRKWLSNIVKSIEYDGKDIVGGPGLTPPNANLLQRLIGYDLDFRFLSTKKGYVKRHPNMNLSLKREIFEKVNFEESLPIAYDTEFGYRVNKLGMKIWFDPNIVVYHNHRSSLKKYMKQQFNSGKYAFLVYEKININTDNINPWWMLYQPILFVFLLLSVLMSVFFKIFFYISWIIFIALNILFLYPIFKQVKMFKKAEVLLLYPLYWLRLVLWVLGGVSGSFLFMKKMFKKSH